MRRVNERYMRELFADKAKKKGIPTPFPGRWPTRIYLHVEHPTGKRLAYYIGKPSQTQYRRIIERSRGANLAFVEFDREHVLVCTGKLKGGIEDDGNLWAFYHPWESSDEPRWAWLSRNIYCKRISSYVMYTCMPRLPKSMVALFKDKVIGAYFSGMCKQISNARIRSVITTLLSEKPNV